MLRAFWNRLKDYGQLRFSGGIEFGPGGHRYVLSSSREAVLYFSSATGEENVRFDAQPARVSGLALRPNVEYAVDYVTPQAGGEKLQTATLSYKGDRIELMLPPFTDDLAVHIYR